MTLSIRLRSIVVEGTTEYRRFKQLEELTGIQADTWKSWYHGRQRPTADMIETASKAWPEYAFWLVTGTTDPEYGHVAPRDQGFPKGGDRKENSAILFKKRIELKEHALKVAKQFTEQDGYDDDLHLIDSWIRTVITIIYSERRLGIQEFASIDMSQYSDAAAASLRAEKLRKAEVLLQNEVIGADSYDEADLVLQRVERLIASANERLEPRLQAILEREKNAIARHFKDRKESLGQQ